MNYLAYSFTVLIALLFLWIPSVFCQTAEEITQAEKSLQQFSEEEFQVALDAYVNRLLIDHYRESLPQEKFLVSLMRLVNHEMDSRIMNRSAAVDKYFADLRTQLNELEQLKGRLKVAGISELDAFINELENRMRVALRQGDVDYKKKKVFEDAIQLLYIAEEMIKLDQLRDTSGLTKKISSSKEQLLTAFGEVGSLDDVPLEVAPTIFNLFDEWRKTDSYKFSARLLDVRIARSNLLKSGSIDQVNRMFNSQLRYAYANFNFYEYDLTERLLEDLILTYPDFGIRDFEDVYFYWGESNFALGRFLRAENIFKDLMSQYSTTAYLSRAYSRLIQIDYKLEKYDDVIKNYAVFQDVASPTQEDYYDIQFIAALTYYARADYNRAAEVLLSFPPKSDYYYFAQYLVGTIYTAGQNFELAYRVFESMATSKKTPQEFHSRSLLKLAQISYERGDYLAAIEYAEFITDKFSRFDKVLNVLAWAHFMQLQTAVDQPEERDFTQAKYYSYRLLQEYYGSEHRMEIQSLLGYIFQTENDLSLARDFYRDVYKSKIERNTMVRDHAQQDSLLDLYFRAREMEEQALRNDDRQGYIRAASFAESIKQQIWDSQIAAKSAIGEEVSIEVNDLINQLSELNQLKQVAREQQNDQALQKIESAMSQVKTALSDYTREDMRQALYVNAFPVAKKVADSEHQKLKNQQLRQSILQELNLIDENTLKLSQEIERMRMMGNYEKLVAMEQKMSKMKEIRKNYDQLYVYAMNLTSDDPYAEFDRWADFGAVGIIDVNFSQRDKLQIQMSRVSTVYNTILDRIVERRVVVEDQMKKIEAEIRFMTMKSRLEERQRLRAEREQSFRETFFDTRTSEFEEK